MKNIINYLSLWHTLLAIALTVMVYLIAIHTSEALSYSTMATYFKGQSASLAWLPSRGAVDHYVLEITDTHFFSGTAQKNVLTKLRYATSKVPSYQLTCEHNHSYQVRVKAVSPTGFSTAYSEPSVLFICDQKKPAILLSPPSAQVRSQRLFLAGRIEEGNLDVVRVNGMPISFHPDEKDFQSSIILHAGENLITITAQDLAGNTTSQNLAVTYAPLTSTSFSRHAYFHPFAVDYNLDGMMDLLVGTEEGKIALFTNTGTDRLPVLLDHVFLSAGGEEIDVGSHATPFMVDYNNDGKNDLLVGNGEGYLVCYLNRGSTTHPHFTAPATIQDVQGKALAVESYCTPYIIDWNDDNTKDILLGSGNGRLVLYRNEGSNADPVFSSPVPVAAGGSEVKIGGHASPLIADWDGDGGKDLLVGDDEGHLYLFLNSVVSGEPDLLTAEEVQADDLELIVDSFAVPFLIDGDQDPRKAYVIGSSNGHLYRPL
jgi:hypothetical protein